jgi:biopolymer transport protein ExbB
MSRRICILVLTAIVGFAVQVPVAAETEGTQPRPRGLDELLREVKNGGRVQQQVNDRREAEFRAAKEQQKDLLSGARATKAEVEERSARLEAQFEENEVKIPQLRDNLQQRLGSLGELFGVVRQVAGDTQAYVQQSLISSQLPGREEFLARLGQSNELPSVEDLEGLWFALQQEMTESGKVLRFQAPVTALEGGETEREVVRVGPFIAVSGGEFLQYLPETRKLVELARQPATKHLRSAGELEAARTGIVGVSIDPSGGSILALLIQTPGLAERIQQGGLVGYVIMGLGAAGLLLVAQRLLYLGVAGRRIRRQTEERVADPGNALGRVLAVYDSNRTADVETLELKLDEAILKETPRLERGNAMIKVLSVVAPLLGLLGTVTGMIETFQAITLFGTGDPKLMASGISQALVTTVLGLTMAIPLVLLHSVVSGRTKELVQILEEQSAGIIAAHAERSAEPSSGAPDAGWAVRPTGAEEQGAVRAAVG